MPRRERFEIWRTQNTVHAKNSAVSSYVWKKFEIDKEDEVNYDSIQREINNFNSKLSSKWVKYKRCVKSILTYDSSWLNEIITFSKCKSSVVPGPSTALTGRPSKDFTDSSSSSKKRKVSTIVKNYSKEELSFAAQTSLRMAGQRDAANLVGEITGTSPKRATKIKKSWQCTKTTISKYTEEEALALYIDGRYSKHSYILMQAGAKKRNANIYPSYNKILKAKNDCYPDLESINITETSAEILLQSLVDHTVTRLSITQNDILRQNIENLSDGLTIIFKWGCDGSSGHSAYKQQFLEDNSQNSDSNLFVVCMVPLHLKNNKTHEVIWINPRPSSTRLCRPIKLLFAKETSDLTKNELENIEK